ncbi:TPA: lipid kinase YegS [Stenotrophomonas maltophilia]|jgi:YegS/Rv2252/BmrU family lipid kinase|uniref:lipid kinase YegS n=1 Tax=Stenotrophomonas maltophilia TaxID=40324 RepID=UPI0005B743E4|nr:lipid kinase YegS [Stenotrophomonas maltophilia]KIS39469.1 lipid kinase YegS-like protein [Stenotrophomonas maltophilia WJ66]MBH1501370.1 lipid kinase YegS [Stenotrophomonas maltophilia]MBH1532101.1 lipid kinase YegS [Stenotrophomonas maltophilia]MCF3459009.1 lipid kinase YegS [Stenotrophomonas maltophilia]MCF3515797.1 lipid kinase YegS [Stenotrophomonas maltophilia]
MTTPRWRLILNGKSAGNDELRDAVDHWRGQGVQLEARVTWEDGDAERYVAEAIDHGVDVIVASGGDGTLSAVAETLAHREELADALPSLALIPMGTANDFATAAGIPTEPKEAFALIGQATPHAIDLLRVNADGTQWWCANLASGGFGTQVTVETDAGLKKMLGGLAYVITGIAKLGRIEPINARLSGPDFAWEGDFIALGIGNGRQAGGGQQLCPQALIDDGLLDVTVLPELEGEVTATLGQMLKSGTQAALEQLATRARLPWLEVASERPLTLNLDGEPVQARQFRIECVPGRVRMHLPPGCPLLAGKGGRVDC